MSDANSSCSLFREDWECSPCWWTAPSQPDPKMVLEPSCAFTHDTLPFNGKAKSIPVASTEGLLASTPSSSSYLHGRPQSTPTPSVLELTAANSSTVNFLDVVIQFGALCRRRLEFNLHSSPLLCNGVPQTQLLMVIVTGVHMV